jgi:hypothetical protein
MPGNRGAPSGRPAAGPAHGPPGAQPPGEVPAQRAAGLQVELLVDGLVGHAHLRVAGVVQGQPAGDLLRAVAGVQPGPHAGGQRGAGRELGGLGPQRAPVRQPLRLVGGVAAVVGPAAALQLPADGRRVAADRPADGTDPLAPPVPDHDLLPLLDGQPPARAGRAHPGVHTATLAEDLLAGEHAEPDTPGGLGGLLPGRHEQPEQVLLRAGQPRFAGHATPHFDFRCCADHLSPRSNAAITTTRMCDGLDRSRTHPERQIDAVQRLDGRRPTRHAVWGSGNASRYEAVVSEMKVTSTQ